MRPRGSIALRCPLSAPLNPLTIAKFRFCRKLKRLKFSSSSIASLRFKGNQRHPVAPQLQVMVDASTICVSLRHGRTSFLNAGTQCLSLFSCHNLSKMRIGLCEIHICSNWKNVKYLPGHQRPIFKLQVYSLMMVTYFQNLFLC